MTSAVPPSNPPPPPTPAQAPVATGAAVAGPPAPLAVGAVAGGQGQGQSTSPQQQQPPALGLHVLGGHGHHRQHRQQQQQQQQLLQQQQAGSPTHHQPPPSHHAHAAALHHAQAASPPSRRDLKSWWKGFKLQGGSRHQDLHGIVSSPRPPSSPHAPPPPPLRNITSSARPVSYSYLEPSFSSSSPYISGGEDRSARWKSNPYITVLQPATSQQHSKQQQQQEQQEHHHHNHLDPPSTPPHRHHHLHADHGRRRHGSPSAMASAEPTGAAGAYRRMSVQVDKLSSMVASNFKRRASEMPLLPLKLKAVKDVDAETEECVTPTESGRPQGIFGVPLRQSITYANVAISLVDENGLSYIYGYVPIVVAKCGVFLKEKATGIEGIFRLSGSEKRIKELKTIFDSPDRYGKGLVWDGYTVHDAANVLRRYLNDLPEPVVPLDVYEKFRDPLRGATKQAVGDAEGPQFIEDFDLDDAIARYQQLITELPSLNRQLLLYILDLLAVFAAKSDENRMNSQNLAAIFQPGMLSHPLHAMAPEEYRLNQCVIIFLIENQDHFLIGMPGTAADNQTVEAVQKGTPPVGAGGGITRSASTASAGAESVAKEGMVRRNKSTSSRHSSSRQSNGGAPSPAGSPGVASTPTGATGSLARSNTVPSKKSPALPAGSRFQGSADLSSSAEEGAEDGQEGDAAGQQQQQQQQYHHHQQSLVAVVRSDRGLGGVAASSPSALEPIPSSAAGRSQEQLPTEGGGESSSAAAPTTPFKEKRHGLFQRSPTADSGAPSTGPLGERTPNKLRKKRLQSGAGANESAQSSNASLPFHTGPAGAGSPSVEVSNPLDSQPHVTAPVPYAPPENRSSSGSNNYNHHNNGPAPSPTRPSVAESSSEQTPRASQVPSNHSNSNTLQPVPSDKNTLKPGKSPPASVHSSFNEGSDMDQLGSSGVMVGMPPAGAEDGIGALQSHAGPSSGDAQLQDKEKKRRWRWSHKKGDERDVVVGGGGTTSSSASAAGGSQQQLALSPPQPPLQQPQQPPSLASPRKPTLGSNSNADVSVTSIGSGGASGSAGGYGNRARKSVTNDSSEVPSTMSDQFYGPPGAAAAGMPQAAGEGEPSSTAGGREGKEGKEKSGPIGWFKNKMREAKEKSDEKRNRSPPATEKDRGEDPAAAAAGNNSVAAAAPANNNAKSRSGLVLPGVGNNRGKSLDLKREEERSSGDAAGPPMSG